ncbi:MAG TPA: CoA-binding protein [Dehalococcoidia bacterium]
MRDEQEAREILTRFRTVAVVGLSSNPARPSYGVARYLQEQGYRIIPVNPHETEVLGERAYPSLRDVPEPVEVVDVFRRPEHTPAVVADAVAVGAKAVWLQLGIVNGEAERLARAAGLLFVQDRCMLVEHRRLKEGGPRV